MYENIMRILSDCIMVIEAINLWILTY